MDQVDGSSLETCSRCQRLVDERVRIKQSFPDHYAKPVGQWGDRRARILIVGLAPGLHGAARTGKAFVGDSSGLFLFSRLFNVGLSDSPDPDKANLLGVKITNAVKCYPPSNRPDRNEILNCSNYLKRELDSFASLTDRKNRSVVALGRVAHRAIYDTLGLKASSFGHGAFTKINPTLSIFSSFHPSRLNVNTKRLTSEMLDSVLLLAKDNAY